MSETAAKLKEAHKLAAGAAGKLSIMLAREKLSASRISEAGADLKAAFEIVSTLTHSKGK